MLIAQAIKQNSCHNKKIIIALYCYLVFATLLDFTLHPLRAIMTTCGDRKIFINKRLKGLPRDELVKLSKSELIDKIFQLEAYNFQLKNILQKKLNLNEKNPGYADMLETGDEASVGGSQQFPNLTTTYNSKDNAKKRKFDFSKSHKRHVLLRLIYFGWDYQGFACQEDSNSTIEYHLFKALTRTCLIESRSTSNYHRCGRTDKEVSAFCQVVSIDLRSKYCEVEQMSADNIAHEIDYCTLLNRVLPKNIQCVSWMPLRSKIYSARFDCSGRTYRYYFPGGSLNIEAMRSGCKLLQRHADFRNFCKMDVHNGVTNYMRHLQSAAIHLCPNQAETVNGGYLMYYLEIRANAFLWHQIRCIMAVLLLIGEEKEEPDVISDLLDVEANPCKPQYTPAIGLPLNLFQCNFRAQSTKVDRTKYDETETDEFSDDTYVTENPQNAPAQQAADTTEWVYNEENIKKLIETIQGEWTQFSVKSTMVRNVLHNLEETLATKFKPLLVKSQVQFLQDSVKPRQYQKLLMRKRCESLENRIDHFVKKQRLIVKTTDQMKVTEESVTVESSS